MKKHLALSFLAALAFLPSSQTLFAQTGFSAASDAGTLLSNGENVVWPNYSSGANYYNDGNYSNAYGVYKIPSSGLYHFDAMAFIAVISASEAPNQNVGVRLVTCNSTGCASPNPATSNTCAPLSTVVEGGYTWLGSAALNEGYVYINPNYTLSVSFTGYFTAGTYVGVCVDDWAFAGGNILQTAANFSGFKIN